MNVEDKYLESDDPICIYGCSWSGVLGLYSNYIQCTWVRHNMHKIDGNDIDMVKKNWNSMVGSTTIKDKNMVLDFSFDFI